MLKPFIVHQFPEPPILLVGGMWIVALSALVGIAFVWRYRRRMDGLGLIVLLISVILWNVFGVFELYATGIQERLLWLKMIRLAIGFAPGATLLTGRIFCADDHPLPQWIKVVLVVVPLIAVLLAFTNEMHSLIWKDFRLDAVTGDVLYAYGPASYAFFLYIYVVLSATTYLIIRAIRQQRGLYRWQAIGMFVAMLPPWIANVLYLLPADSGTLFAYDYTPIAFGLTGVLLAINVIVFKFMDRVPIGGEQILASMDQGVLVLDDKGRVLDVNPALCKMFGFDKSKTVGESVFDVFGAWAKLIEDIYTTPSMLVEKYFEDVGYLAMHFSELRRRGMDSNGWIVLITDISARKQAEQDLLDAQNTIKTLGDLIPICAWCGRRIELEDGTWVEVDKFIEEHSQAEMTHGICPACASKLKR